MPCFFCYMPARGKFFLSFFQKRTQNSLYHTYSSHVHNFLSCNKCRSRNLSYTDNCKRILGNKKKENATINFSFWTAPVFHIIFYGRVRFTTAVTGKIITKHPSSTEIFTAFFSTNAFLLIRLLMLGIPCFLKHGLSHSSP